MTNSEAATAKPKILILRGDSYHAVAAMFIERGYKTTFDHKDDVDVICFTGGSDVSPHLYGEENTGESYCDPVRDTYETEVYEAAIEQNIPMVGICRGGQFLNVMNGGSMLQHVGNMSGYVYIDVPDGRELLLHVDHHQGIVQGSSDAMYINEGEGRGWVDDMPTDIDYAGYFPDTKCLIFQPHPEWGHLGTETYFFELFDRHIVPNLGE